MQCTKFLHFKNYNNMNAMLSYSLNLTKIRFCKTGLVPFWCHKLAGARPDLRQGAYGNVAENSLQVVTNLNQ